MIYTVSFDKKVVVRSQIQDRFDDLTLFSNTTKPTPADVEKLAVDYRNLGRPPVINLMIHKDPAVTDALVAGWYPTDMVLKHASTHSTAPNFDGGSFPVLEVNAGVGTVFALINYRACIGVSIDGGVTWIPLDGTAGTKTTVRTFGWGQGQSVGCYNAVTNLHYMAT